MASVRKHAANALRRLIAELRAGKTPHALGLDPAEQEESPELQRFAASVAGDASGPIDVDAYRDTRGTELEWADTLLFWALGRLDPRGPAAIHALGLAYMADALRELAAGTGPVSLEAQRALDEADWKR